jgi:hypothetical protein
MLGLSSAYAQVMDFYDSTNPDAIPEGSSACLYWDGDFAAQPAAARRFKATRWITVLGGTEAAAFAGIADFEAGNEVYSKPELLHAWVAARQAAGHRARVYCDRADLAKVRATLGSLPYLVWLATLDGDKLNRAWTSGLWAVQYAGGPRAPYDTSVLYGEW